MKSHDRCHLRRAAAGAGAAACHNGRVGHEPVDHTTALAGFRRYTWWTVPGATAFILVVAFADWVVDPEVPAWARGTCGVALAATAPTAG